MVRKGGVVILMVSFITVAAAIAQDSKQNGSVKITEIKITDSKKGQATGAVEVKGQVKPPPGFTVNQVTVRLKDSNGKDINQDTAKVAKDGSYHGEAGKNFPAGTYQVDVLTTWKDGNGKKAVGPSAPAQTIEIKEKKK